MKKTLLAAALAALSGQAFAAIDFSKAYYGGMFSYLQPDNARVNDAGYGGQLVAGYPLRPNLNLETNLFTHYLTRKANDNRADLATGFGADLVLHQTLKGVTTFALAGAGGIYEDITKRQGTHAFLNGGLGLITQLPYKNFSVRGEVRGVYDFNRNTTFSGDPTTDVRLNVGVLYNFWGIEPVEAPAPIVPPTDTDGDGVVDPVDQCPGTPPGSVVDATGCPAAAGDADGDGVADTVDQCPDTPAGTAVDTSGCPLPVAAVSTDDDADGVTNDADKCPNTPKDFKVDTVGCLVEQTVVLQTVNFDLDSDKLTTEAKAILDGIAKSLVAQAAVKLQVVGHTDALGPQSYNLSLSQKRAKAVKSYLTEAGVAADRLSSDGEGEFNPIASNDKEDGRAKNRRVEFKIVTQ